MIDVSNNGNISEFSIILGVQNLQDFGILDDSILGFKSKRKARSMSEGSACSRELSGLLELTLNQIRNLLLLIVGEE